MKSRRAYGISILWVSFTTISIRQISCSIPAGRSELPLSRDEHVGGAIGGAKHSLPRNDLYCLEELRE